MHMLLLTFLLRRVLGHLPNEFGQFGPLCAGSGIVQESNIALCLVIAALHTSMLLVSLNRCDIHSFPAN
jgi:hypothetical protein